METIKKLDLNSFNISEDKKSKLKEVFPEVFCENKIDFEKLKLAETLVCAPFTITSISETENEVLAPFEIRSTILGSKTLS